MITHFSIAETGTITTIPMERNEISLSPDETLDAFLDGKLKVIQKRHGYRFSVDTVILSEFIRIRRGEKAIDIGTGCGILPLILCLKTRVKHIVGVEIQKDLADLARKNVILNCLEDRITIIERDFRELKTIFPTGSFNVVLSNPPYRKFSSGRLNPLPEKAMARHELKGTLEDLISVTSYLLPPKGRCYFVYPASRAVDMLCALRKERLEPKRLRFVHPRSTREARFLLVEANRDSGVEVKILEPLFLDDRAVEGNRPCRESL